VEATAYKPINAQVQPLRPHPPLAPALRRHQRLLLRKANVVLLGLQSESSQYVSQDDQYLMNFGSAIISTQPSSNLLRSPSSMLVYLPVLLQPRLNYAQNWGTIRTPNSQDYPFWAMQWGPDSISSLASGVSSSGAKIVLAFNEPDALDQVSKQFRCKHTVDLHVLQAHMDPVVAASRKQSSHFAAKDQLTGDPSVQAVHSPARGHWAHPYLTRRNQWWSTDWSDLARLIHGLMHGLPDRRHRYSLVRRMDRRSQVVRRGGEEVQQATLHDRVWTPVGQGCYHRQFHRVPPSCLQYVPLSVSFGLIDSS
jgi:hypothetical protein